MSCVDLGYANKFNICGIAASDEYNNSSCSTAFFKT